MRLRKILSFSVVFFFIFLLPVFFPAHVIAAENDAGTEVHWQDYIGKRIGVLTGTPLETVAEEHFKGSKILYFNSYPDLSVALLAGNIDAFLVDEPEIKMIRAAQPEIDYLPEKFTDNNYSFAFRKNDPDSAALCNQLNEFIAKIRADGTLKKMEEIWLGTDDSLKTVDASDLTGQNGTLNVATTSTDMPWSYIKDGVNVGYDIDLVTRFCREYGYGLKLTDVDFAGRIPAVESGKCDFTTDMNVTPEREEEVLFSSPTASGGIVLAVPASDLAGSSVSATGTNGGKTPEFTSFDQMNGKTISMLTGAPFENLISSKVPNVKEFTYYQSAPDMVLGLTTGKTDAGLFNNAVAKLIESKQESLITFPESLGDSFFGLGFAKGDKRCGIWQSAYDSIPQETKDALWNKWTGADESLKVIPEQDWPGTGGTVKVAACDALEPMSYMGQDGQVIGLDVETILLIAKELDVHVEFTPMDFSGVMSSLESGKADIICGSIVVTDERKESADFLEYSPASFVLLVRTAQAAAEDQSFLARLKSSFQKTFIREDRYKLFISGIITTAIITVLSVLFGTILGFVLFLLCRKEGRIPNAITGFFIWLIQGMPVVVLLMILYYIIFAGSEISGTSVAVIAFTLVFGAGVFGRLKSGVAAIDKGQREAALALGYGDLYAFFRIILPQMVPHILPAYKGDIVSLLKATAIVGYIAVQDLTKMGDIIRGRTYEAFFPLLAVAVLYFAMAGLLTFLVGRIEININPRRRNRDEILKGIKL